MKVTTNFRGDIQVKDSKSIPAENKFNDRPIIHSKMSWLHRCNKPRAHVKYVNKKLRAACHCAKPSLICTHDACRCLVFVRTQDRLLPYIFCNKFKVLLICTFILGFLHFFICRKFSASSSELEDRSMVSITCTENISVTIIDNCLN